MQAMIFAAGLGTRLKPLTDRIPKALVPLAGRTLLEWQILKLREAGIERMVVNVHHKAELIEQYLNEQRNFGCDIQISDEKKMLLNTGGGLRKARGLFEKNEPVLALNVDILSNIDLHALLRAYQADDFGLLVVSERRTERYLLFDDEQVMRGWTNRKTGEVRGNIDESLMFKGKALRLLAFSGMQVLSWEAMERLDALEGSFSLIDFYVQQCERERLRAFVPQDYRMMDVGKIDQIEEAEAFAEGLL